MIIKNLLNIICMLGILFILSSNATACIDTESLAKYVKTLQAK